MKFIALHFLKYLDFSKGLFGWEISRHNPVIYPLYYLPLSPILDGKI